MVAELFNWRANLKQADTVKPWRPKALTHGEWPPDYRGVYAFRIHMLAQFAVDDRALENAKIYYRTRPAEFIQHWMDTYNPRKTDMKWMPFVFFKRQHEFIDYIQACRKADAGMLIEKCRDVGATWLACAYSVWAWIFEPQCAIGWGSRKQELVHKIGDPDSIFEKIFQLLRRLPKCWMPDGFSWRDHATFMKLINPANDSIISGEAGDNIGRGGRKTFYFKDEAAHYERPELIEAALGDNTNVQIDISSVNGLGNVFHKRREAGMNWAPGAQIDRDYTQVFVFDWRDHPEKTQTWYDARKAKAEREGMQHIFAQEVDRNYSASIGNTIIPYEWITACVDAHKTIPYVAEYIKQRGLPKILRGGLDVADGGIDRNALAIGEWIIIRSVEEWGERDPGVTARRAAMSCKQFKGIKVQYDSIGVGSNVKSEFNRWNDDPELKKQIEGIDFIGWNAASNPQWPMYRVVPDDDESPTNEAMFQNLKAQAWWSLRTRCYKTFQAVTNKVVYAPDELISFDSEMGSILQQLMKELAQAVKGPSTRLKLVIDKQPDGTKSPNLADAVVMLAFPIDEPQGVIIGHR